MLEDNLADPEATMVDRVVDLLMVDSVVDLPMVNRVVDLHVVDFVVDFVVEHVAEDEDSQETTQHTTSVDDVAMNMNGISAQRLKAYVPNAIDGDILLDVANLMFILPQQIPALLRK